VLFQSDSVPPGDAFASTASARLDPLHPREIVAWAAHEFGDGLIMSSSFGAESAALLHMTARILPRIPVIVVDTGFLFDETRAFIDQLSRRLNLNLVIVRPLKGSAQYLRDADEQDPSGRHDVEGCCAVNKVEPFERAMRDLGPRAWLRGIRADQTQTRRRSGIVEWSRRFECWAISPLSRWSSDDVRRYLREHDLPLHPLTARGYQSIGCSPLSCTRAVIAGEDARAGRWAGSEKTECGLHLECTAASQIA